MLGLEMQVKAMQQDGMKQLADRLKLLARTDVLVGIPEDDELRKPVAGKPNQPTNAQILYVFSNGSPIKNQPARPVIEPAITADDNRKGITDELALAIQACLNRKPDQMKTHMQRAGQLGQNAARGWFTDPRNNWAPNSPITIMRKLEKLNGKKSKAAWAAFAAGESTYTLDDTTYDINQVGVDTGQMRKAIIWVLREVS